jgi:heme a synthase
VDQTTAARSSRLTGFAKLTIVTTGLTLVLIALGGAVRATGSGLACPDWPFCYGKVIPRQADIPPETHYTLVNVWLEHSHRLVASVVGLLVAAILVWALARFRHRPGILWPAVVAAVAVNVQAALGAMVVLRNLLAELVTAHLGMAMIVVAALVLITVNASLGPRPQGHQAPAQLRFARLSAGVAALAYVQILVGGHVTGVRAGLAYGRHPLLFDGAVIPQIGSSLQAWNVAHRLLAYLLAAAVLFLAVKALRHRREVSQQGGWTARHRWLVKLSMWAATLVVVQILLGFANLMLATPPGTVIGHLTVASWIWTVLVVLTVLAYRLASEWPTNETAARRTADQDSVRA